jgi:hypothetical protein
MSNTDSYDDPARRLMSSLFNDRENDLSERPRYVFETTSKTTGFFPPTDDSETSSGTAWRAISQDSTLLHRNVGSGHPPTAPFKSDHASPSTNAAADNNRNRILSNKIKRNSPNLPPNSKASAKLHLPLTNTISQKREETTSEKSSTTTTDFRYTAGATRLQAKVEPRPSSNTFTSRDHHFVDARNATLLKLFVDDYSDDDYWYLLDSINSNHVVEKVIIFRKRQNDGERIRTCEEMEYLFRALANRSTGSLTQLHLWNFLPTDLPSLSFGIMNHPSIFYLQLHMESGSLDKTTVSALASMEKLVSIELEVNSSFPVGDLLASESLVVVGVISDKFIFESKDILVLAEMLEMNSTLQVLVLEPQIPRWCLGSVLCSLNATTSSAVDTFEFSCRAPSTQEGDDSMNEVIQTLQNGYSPLRVIWNHSYESFEVCEGMKMETLNALKLNKGMEQFHVFLESHEFCSTKCEILERNVKEKH